MYNALCLCIAMTVSQGGSPSYDSTPSTPQFTPATTTNTSPYSPANMLPEANQPPGQSQISVDTTPPTGPANLPYLDPNSPISRTPARTTSRRQDKKDDPDKKDPDKKDDEKKDEEKKEEEKFFFMKMLSNTPTGDFMDKNRLSFSGWTEMSFTGSQASVSNLPVTWNDRANRFLLQQQWMRFERTLDTDSKEASWGFRVDTLAGTDYRFTLMRGLFNQQLLNSAGNQNLYGLDLPQAYVNWYLPNLFEGTEIRLGRMFTPWGFESIEGISTPLLSRSYAFNWSPPFTHMALMVAPNFNKNWSAKLMLANGNDVFFDASEELRTVGVVSWISDDKKDNLNFGWSLGRGKFNASAPFNPENNGLQSEPAGRNNINTFDLVYSHEFTDKFTYAFEGIFGYQYGVPANIPGGIIKEGVTSGTAHWGSFAQYFIYKWDEKLSSIIRAELFDDMEGQRTGYEGLYEAVTVGVQYKPKPWLWFRPEIRYDYNGLSKAFNNGTQHGLLTAATDMIIRW